jgi:uncharacterized protein (UPF0332 family)
VTGENRSRNALLELEKSAAALQAARALGDLDLWDDAVSRAYYAAFHAATAALYAVGVQSKSHAGAHDLFFEHYVRSGLLSREVAKDLAALQRFREQADYSTIIRFDAASGAPELERAERFVAAVQAALQRQGTI